MMISWDMYRLKSSDLFFYLRSYKYFAPIFLGSTIFTYFYIFTIYQSLNPFLLSILYFMGFLLLSMSIYRSSFFEELTLTGISFIRCSKSFLLISFYFSDLYSTLLQLLCNLKPYQSYNCLSSTSFGCLSFLSLFYLLFQVFSVFDVLTSPFSIFCILLVLVAFYLFCIFLAASPLIFIYAFSLFFISYYFIFASISMLLFLRSSISLFYFLHLLIFYSIILLISLILLTISFFYFWCPLFLLTISTLSLPPFLMGGSPFKFLALPLSESLDFYSIISLTPSQISTSYIFSSFYIFPYFLALFCREGKSQIVSLSFCIPLRKNQEILLFLGQHLVYYPQSNQLPNSTNIQCSIYSLLFFSSKSSISS